MTYILILAALALPLIIWAAIRGYTLWSPGQGSSAPGVTFQAFPTATPQAATAGPVAATSMAPVLPAAQNKVTFIEGFDLQGLGATAGSNISVTITGLAVGTLTIGVAVPTGVGVFLNPGAPAGYSFRFPTPLPAGSGGVIQSNTSITVNVPSFGAGNTYATVIAYGFQA